MISAILLVQLLVAAVVVILKSADCTPVPKQNVSPGAGFIPVFIRVGDTPLENINPELAEAFEVYAIKNGRVQLVLILILHVLMTPLRRKCNQPT
ncbi:unnamed protein product [Acanthoscelides obtectus]|uniref:Secreted protein n=1 Tax=Acanthoscelides obtectus TaxID=200917 RepID=A0A9P0JQN6_ACAOB|nr:unnamed protein product [Acanthoscelides obtectus]CAK1673613.1 hypothetical protein AOBTE_LOCUS29395 [Acanthoscelides obtectus]